MSMSRHTSAIIILTALNSMDMDIGIIGAGVIGLMSALVLAEAGYSVTVLAREFPGNKSKKWASPWYIWHLSHPS
jgi:glycine/D-amino acid oxidase-like deaminating enzyme